LTDFVLVAEQGLAKELLFHLVASAENASEHPLAEAIVRKAREEGVSLASPETFTAIPGRGIQAEVEGYSVLFGNLELIEERGMSGITPKVQATATGIAAEGRTALYLAVNGAVEAVVGIADQIKAEAAQTIARLKKMGLHVIMLTGDHQATAEAIAKQAGIDEVIAQVLPEEKAAKVKEVQAKGIKVAMVGDGINDAPAMALADVGIAMGTGIDVAIESGDIVLMKGDLGGVVTALQLSRATMSNIKQNLFWAFAYNIIGIPVAAGLLYLFGGPTLNPMIAGGAMALSSVSVVSNALRLRLFSPTR
jgi:Cu+-exporting ATPase